MSYGLICGLSSEKIVECLMPLMHAATQRHGLGPVMTALEAMASLPIIKLEKTPAGVFLKCFNACPGPSKRCSGCCSRAACPSVESSLSRRTLLAMRPTGDGLRSYGSRRTSTESGGASDSVCPGTVWTATPSSLKSPWCGDDGPASAATPKSDSEADADAFVKNGASDDKIVLEIAPLMQSTDSGQCDAGRADIGAVGGVESLNDPRIARASTAPTHQADAEDPVSAEDFRCRLKHAMSLERTPENERIVVRLLRDISNFAGHEACDLPRELLLMLPLLLDQLADPNTPDVEIFEVEDLLEHKSVDNKDYYLVKWKGYTETSWEPDENI